MTKNIKKNDRDREDVVKRYESNGNEKDADKEVKDNEDNEDKEKSEDDESKEGVKIMRTMVKGMRVIKVMMTKMIMMMLARGWRPHGGKRAQRDTALKLIVIYFAEIQN